MMINLRKGFKATIIFVLFLLSLLSCKSAQELKIQKETETMEEYVEKEKELGRAVFAKLAGKFGVVKDEEATKYLNMLGKSIGLYTERQELEYFFAILNTDQINAYALPGGYILISKGTLKSITNKGELIGVLSHELGHINKKHVLKGVKIQVKFNFFESLARILAGPRQVITNIVNQVSDKIEEKLFMEGLAADDEFEADNYAVNLMQSIGISAVDYLENLKSLSSHTDDKAMEELDKTHPDINVRLQKIESILNKNLKSSSTTDSFIAFKTIIDKI